MEKTLKSVTLYVVVIVTISLILVLALSPVFKHSMAKTTAVSVQIVEQEGYRVGVSNGHVAIFEVGRTSEPMVETNIDVAGLRSVDRQMLDSGIIVVTYEDVLKLLEDFGS